MKLTVLLLSALSAIGLARAGDLEVAVQEVFRKVLGLRPPDLPVARPASTPKYMMALFRKYSSGKGMSTANPSTVRNILPMKGPASLSDLVLFNVSCVGESEEVRLGQLHLNRRRLHQRHLSRRMLAPPYRVRLYRVSGTRLTSLGSVPVPQATRAAWHSVDITSPLRELLLDTDALSMLLGVRFEAPKGKPLTPKHFLRETPGSSSSFLVIFSEDNPENEVADDEEIKVKEPPIHSHDLAMQIQSATRGKWAEQSNDLEYIFPDSASSSNMILDKVNASASKTSQESENRIDNLINVKTPPTRHMARQLPSGGRERRSIEDNELPDIKPINSWNVSQILVAKQHPAIPLPAARWGKGRKGGNGKKKNKKVKAEEAWQNSYQPDNEFSNDVCRIRRLEVNFEDIGWGQWIIAPATFQANYCSGTCSFPLTTAVRPTNHAALQSLVHALGRPGVPPPSCAPDQLSPSSFLYMDESGNVVLKKYPNMRVESCSCR